ncbi:MAG: hypothetical protein LBL96_01095 [Clostridiales bacterium]|jgi:hypothetical protein|nr:hypothetical protein [Clostridiales bacterium]
MKKFCLVFLALLLLAFAGCDSHQTVKIDNGVQTTDLSDIEIDGLKIGTPIANADLTRYTKADISYSKYTYDYQEIRIAVNGYGLITGLQGTAGIIPFSLNGHISPTKISETIDILGKNHNNYWFDSEQKIKANTYIDKEHHISLTIAYSTMDNGLVWAILSSIS